MLVFGDVGVFSAGKAGYDTCFRLFPNYPDKLSSVISRLPYPVPLEPRATREPNPAEDFRSRFSISSFEWKSETCTRLAALNAGLSFYDNYD